MIFILQSTNPATQAQWLNRHPRADTYWLNLGAGFNSFGFSIGGGASYQLNYQIVAARWVYSEQIPLTDPYPTTFLRDLSLLYGIEVFSDDWDFVSLAIGLTYLSGRDRGRFLYSTVGIDLKPVDWHESKSVSAVGVALEAQAFWRPSPFFGTGITVFGNVTKPNIVGGILLTFQLGKLEKL